MFSETFFFNSPQSGVSNDASPRIFCNGRSCPLRALKSKTIYLGHANTDDKHPVLPLCWCHGGLFVSPRQQVVESGRADSSVSNTQPQQRRVRLTSRTAKIVCGGERERMSHSVPYSLSTNHGQVLLNANEVQCPRDSSPQDHHLLLNSTEVKI